MDVTPAGWTFLFIVTVFLPFAAIRGADRARKPGGAPTRGQYFISVLFTQGLGLFIARRIVTQHGGRVHVGPREGGGAVCTIALPCPVAEGGGYAASRADRNRGAITRGRSR